MLKSADSEIGSALYLNVMSVVYYKFKSSNEFDTVTFDGIGITLADFRKSIYGQKKLGKPSELDEIQVKNAQTQEEYVKDDDMIPRNASVIISRVPVGGIAKTSAWKQGSDSPYQGVCCLLLSFDISNALHLRLHLHR